MVMFMNDDHAYDMIHHDQFIVILKIGLHFLLYQDSGDQCSQLVVATLVPS